jgi:hypothetical protein
VRRSKWCNILAASPGRPGECGLLVTNQFEGPFVVLVAQLTRDIRWNQNSHSQIEFHQPEEVTTHSKVRV